MSIRNMTVNERLEDISKRSGFSVETVRCILEAERDSTIDSLKRGERATLIGRCTMVPSLGAKMDASCGSMKTCISVNVQPVGALRDALSKCSSFDLVKLTESEKRADAFITTRQIGALV